jgi:hypothetical protein
MPIQLAKLLAVRKCTVDGHCVTIYSILLSRFSTFYSFLFFIFFSTVSFLLASLLRLIFRTWNFDCSNSCMRILLKMLTAVTFVSLRWWLMDGVFSVHVERCAFSLPTHLVWRHLWKVSFSATKWRELIKSSSNRFDLTKMPFSVSELRWPRCPSTIARLNVHSSYLFDHLP